MSEAAKLWGKVGAAKDRVIAVPGLKENFWAMGDTGPCGPCSEIFYDMGPAASDQGHADCKFGCECGRYVEIWNLVFMQFNRDADGKLNPLPKPSVDTGMGLERVTAVLEGKISNFDTDLFMPLIHKAEEFTDARYGRDAKLDPSFRIVADHARATTFLICDGVMPSNEGRGYVLRKIMRRGMRHARLLEPTRAFFTDMVVAVRDLMAEAYPELMGPAGEHALKVVSEEEHRFQRTVDVALGRLDLFISHAKQEAAIEKAPTVAKLAGRSVFELYDTYGLPRDFIEDVTHDAGVKVDWDGFDHAMEEQRTRAKASWKGVHKDVANPAYTKLAETLRPSRIFTLGPRRGIAGSKRSSRRTAR